MRGSERQEADRQRKKGQGKETLSAKQTDILLFT